jgi:hypothetical protein
VVYADLRGNMTAWAIGTKEQIDQYKPTKACWCSGISVHIEMYSEGFVCK